MADALPGFLTQDTVETFDPAALRSLPPLRDRSKRICVVKIPDDWPAGISMKIAEALLEAGFRYDPFDEGIFVCDSPRKVISVRWLKDRPLEQLRAAIASRQGDVEFYFGRMAEDLARTLKRRYEWS